MNWLTGGGGDDSGGGWEEDDDLGDLSDQSLENQNEEDSGNEGAPQASHFETQHHQQQQGGGVQLGGGMFMGRLTRFLEAVTQPASDEDEEYEDEGNNNGWGDDDLGGLDEDEEDDHAAAGQEYSQEEIPTTTFMQPPPVEATASQLMDSGWDDGLDLSFEPQLPVFTTTTTTGEQIVPLNDVPGRHPATEQHHHQQPQQFGRNVSFEDFPAISTNNNQNNSGWGNDDDIVVEETMPPPAPSRQVSSLSNAARTEGAVANSTSSGWDEDDQELDGLDDEFGDDNENGVVTPQVVDHTPLPPPPIPSPRSAAMQSRVTTSSTLQSHSVGASSAALAPSSVLEDGWDDEDVDGILDDEEEQPPTQILDHTPPLPPPRPANDTTSQAVSFAAMSVGAVAASTASGWDEDDGTLDDPDVDEDIIIQEEPPLPPSNDKQEHQPTLILDHTPPPPPPPAHNDVASLAVSFAARSTGAVATSNESGWDDDGTFDDLEEEEDVDDGVKQVVDLTPPPPLPPRESQGTASASAVAVGTITEDNGWDDDDDDLDQLGDEEEGQEQDATPLVDHTPPPPPPPKDTSIGRDYTTDAAVMDMDDDISRDDTLSIANSRARHEEHQHQLSQTLLQGPPVVDQVPASLGKPIAFKRTETTDAIKSSNNSVGSSTVDEFRPMAGENGSNNSIEDMMPLPEDNIVDHTPSVSRLDRHSSAEESMMVLAGGGGGNSSVSDSWDSLSDRFSDAARPRNRRMVDLTPPVARFHRGVNVDTSLAVAGHTSVGESLDSIDEENEEPESPQQPNREDAPTPVAVEAGWGGTHHRPHAGDEYTIDINQRVSTAIPFGSAITPTTSSSSGIPRTTLEDDEADDDGVPLVDHTPIPLVKNVSTAASVDVLSVSSEEGDLGESIVGIDDVKEDLYGQVVDHTPATPNPAERPRVDGVGLQAIVTKQEDDTVVGVAENTEVEKDIKADDEMDDESSRGTKTTNEEFENRSLISSVRVTIPEEKQLVDHVPPARKMSKTMDASTMVFGDASTASSEVGDDIANDDDTSPARFGPIVDHTPNVHFRTARSVATSVVTQTSGLDVELKEDDDLDNTVGAAGSTDGGPEEEGWGAEHSSLPPSVSEEKHLVDHVPSRSSSNSRIPPMDGSMRVMVDNADDLTQGVDTIAEDAALDFGPIVDHTPFTARSVAYSVAASLATQPDKPDDDMDNTTAVGGVSIEGGDGWDNDIPDLEDISAGDDGVMDEIKEPTLVDHVPHRSFPHTADASTMVLLDPMDAGSTVGYDDTTANNAQDDRYGPVVDHTPTPPMSGAHMSVDASMRVQASEMNAGDRQDDDEEDGGTWFGASTVGGVSTVGASGEASTAEDDSSRGGWDDDGDILDDLASPTSNARRLRSNERHDVVDHVPQIAPPGPTDASLAVMVDPSVASSHAKEENEDNIDTGSFGAVVDHTPSITKASHHSVANSIATNATGISTDIKRDEEMDETTWNGGASTRDEGWDQDEPELQDLVDVDEDQMPPLVDHVPERPESRPTDASTFVAGEASEIFSQVDDLGQDETYFGPVVDQTPHAQFSVHASAAGSTIVNIASVAEDDLDVAVENAIAGEDPRREAQEQIGWQETLPNPQSGNDEDNQDREQLVDYVPDEQQEIPDLVRDGSSEMATVGEKSTMLPADDPKEDEFGPVVDQLPIPQESNTPTLSPVTASHSGARKKAPSVASSGAQNVDSIAPNFSVESKGSKEDGLDEDEFGPVVDHLPNASSRASFTPSRGGSTVDALATVSEVEDDYVAGDGWEDDVDIDVGDQPSPNASTRPGDDRNLSVKWIDGLSGKNSTGGSATGETGYFDAEMGDSSRTPLNETRYYDPELGDTNTWGSLNLYEADDGDDTPPSTPRGSFESRKVVDVTTEDAKPAAVTIISGGECKHCANASTADCPCVKRLLAANAGKEGIIGSLKTPEGNMVKVNFDKLLETEMTKRRLVEKEFQALRTTIESLKSSKDTLVLAGETQMDILNKMKNSNHSLSHDLEAARSATDGLRAQNEDFKARNRLLEDQMASLDEEKLKLETECLALKRDMEVLQAQITQISSSATSNLSSRENELQSEISRWKGSNEELSHKIARFETECENLRGKNESLYEDLETYRESMSKLEDEKAAMLSKESSLNVEIKHLKGSLQSQRVATSGTFQAQITALQSEIAAKSGECAELKSQVASLQNKLNVSEAEKFKHTKELARVAKDKEQTIAEFETRIAKKKEEMEDVLRAKDASIEELKKKLTSESQIIQKLKEEKANLENLKKTDALAHQGAIAEKNRQILAVDNARKTTAAKVDALEKEKIRLSTEITALTQRAAAAEARNKDLPSLQKERDDLQAELERRNAAVVQMQAQIEQYDSRIEENASNWQREISSLQQERDRLESEVASSGHTLEEMSRSLHSVEIEKDDLRRMVADLQSKCEELESASQQVRPDEESLSSTLRTEFNELQRRLTAAESHNQTLVAEQMERSKHHLDLETRLSQALSDLAMAQSEKSNWEARLSESENLARSLRVEMDQVKSDRQQLQLKYQDILSNSSSAMEDAQKSRSAYESNQKDLEGLAAECDSLRRELADALARYDARESHFRHLENELSKSNSLLAEKEQSIVALKEQQKSTIAGFMNLQSSNKMLTAKIEDLEAEIQSFALERASLKRSAEQYANSMEQLSNQLEAVSMQRDTFEQERIMLEEENEEMLVQFGLLKEEMDATDEQLQQLDTQRAEWERAAQDSQWRLEETQRRLDELSSGLKTEAHQALATMEAEKGRLANEKHELQIRVQDLAEMNNTLQGKLQAFESEKLSLLARLDELGRQVSESVSASESKEARLMSIISDLEEKNQDLSSQSRFQENQISELQASLDRSESTAKDVTDLRRRLSSLEQALAENQRLLEQKDGTLEDLRFQLENAGKEPVESAELETLRRTVREMAESAERDRSNIQELEGLSDETTRELKKTLDQLSSAEALVGQLRNELSEKQRNDREASDLQRRLLATEQQLAQANEDASSFRTESTNLRGRLAELQSELDDYRRTSQQPAKEPSGQSSAEMQSLRQQIEQLKQQQIASSSQTGAREEVIEREVHLLQQQMRQKDGEISKLERELQSLGSDLSHKHKELQSKQQYVDKLSSELEDLRAQANQASTTRALELTRDDAEDAEKMRSQIISLARALEQSESRRAVAIERLESERQANADSLRRLTESVKRFYSTLSLGDN